MDAYACSIVRFVEQARAAGLLGGLSTAYIGGGTPTMLGSAGLACLIEAATDKGTAPLEELTFEANPESLGQDVLSCAKQAGATRVSIGVQSFEDRELEALGRAHDSALARERVTAAVDSGLDVSLDLMCGIPYQTPHSWEYSLATAVDLGVGHVSCYPLMIEPGTAMERMCEAGELPWPSDDTEADDMEAAERVLSAAGLARYEVASYARPGKCCAHNIAYWTGVEYLGLGTAASSMLGRASYDALRALVPSLPAPGDDAERFRLTITNSTRDTAAMSMLDALSFEVEQLTAREAVAEDLMLGARMTRGLSAALLVRATSVLGERDVQDTLVDLERKGLLAPADDGSWQPTHAGWLLGNELYGPLWDLA